MDRRREDRRPPRGDDSRSHRPRYEQERSRSPPRRERRDDRRRDRSPPRNQPPSRSGPPSRSDRDKDYTRTRDTDRSGPARGRPNDRPPAREQLDSRPNGAIPKGPQSARGPQKTEPILIDDVEDEDEEAAMQRVMGFKDFRTTKNSKVPGNDKNYGVYKVKKSEYRQYMNRTGGFNRPLSPSRM